MNKFIVVLLLTGQFAWAQDKKDLAVTYMLRGYFYASSSVLDSLALGGYGGSSNFAKSVSSALPFAPQGLQLYIDTTQKATFAREFNGHTVFLVNATNTQVGFSAMDSRLSIHAEALIDNQWKPIEYLPSSWCGNSYHTLYLPAGQYWSFNAPVYTGNFKTKIRYKLTDKLRSKQVLYSNEVTAFINKGQLTQQQGHQPTSLMDPYNN